MPSIKDARFVILATDGFEQSELMKPLEQLKKAGARVAIAAPQKTRKAGEIRGWNKGEWGDTVPVGMSASDVQVGDFDALVLPGGQMNPDMLRVDPEAMRVVRDFLQSGKTVAAICHAPWLIAEAGAARGRTMTSYHSIRTDITNAGAHWVDEPVVVDHGLITSRQPGDLDAFVRKIIETVEGGDGEHERNGSQMLDAILPGPGKTRARHGAGSESIRTPMKEGGVGH
jgi:protease I